MFLYELKENQIAKVKRLTGDSEFSKRLRDMGMSEGERVKCVKIAALKSPVLYRVKGSLISIRTADAKGVEIEYE